jgi:N-acetylgalactosamine-6-sulfatase
MTIVTQCLSTLSILICLTKSAFSKPNVIIIFTDDIGWGDLSCTGHPYAETPSICRLAEEGTIFENFYVTGNVCPHSRTGLMTSRNPSWFPNYTAEYGFMGALTVTNLMKDAGYHTGHLGKWNIGSDPEGDAQDYGILTVERVGSEEDDPFGREGLRFTKAIDFVEDHKDEPFYLNLWIYATHTPIDPPQVFIDRYKDLFIDYSKFDDQMQEVSNVTMHKYLADLYSLDLNVGRLLDKLDELGLAENTVIAFSSDNGPQNGQGTYYYKPYSTFSNNFQFGFLTVPSRPS